MIIMINNIPFNETELNITPVFDCNVSSYLYNYNRGTYKKEDVVDSLIEYVKTREDISKRETRKLKSTYYLGYDLSTCVYCFVVQTKSLAVYSQWYKTKEEADAALMKFIQGYNMKWLDNFSFEI